VDDDTSSASSETQRWKVRRVWGLDGIDEREEEYEVDDKDLMDRVKILLGVPTEASWVFGEGAEYDATASEWKVKMVYDDVDGEAHSRGRTQLLNEDGLRNGLAVALEETSVDASCGLKCDSADALPAIGKQGKESEFVVSGDSNPSSASDEKKNTPKDSFGSEANPSKATSAQGESEEKKEKKKKKKKKKKKVEEECSLFDLLGGGPKVTTVSYSYNY
jgi:hypothetical protein